MSKYKYILLNKISTLILIATLSGCASSNGRTDQNQDENSAASGIAECVGDECGVGTSAQTSDASKEFNPDGDADEASGPKKAVPMGSLSGSCEIVYGNPKTAAPQSCPTLNVTVFSSDGNALRTARIGGARFKIPDVKLGETYRLLIKPINNAWVKRFENISPDRPAELRIQLPLKMK